MDTITEEVDENREPASDWYTKLRDRIRDEEKGLDTYVNIMNDAYIKRKNKSQDELDGLKSDYATNYNVFEVWKNIYQHFAMSNEKVRESYASMRVILERLKHMSDNFEARERAFGRVIEKFDNWIDRYQPVIDEVEKDYRGKLDRIRKP